MKATLTVEDHEGLVRVRLDLDPPLEEQTEPTQASFVINQLVRRLSELTTGTESPEATTGTEPPEAPLQPGPSRN